MEVRALLGVLVGQLVADRVAPRGGTYCATRRIYMCIDFDGAHLRGFALNLDPKPRIYVLPM
jgi:hypothetical protein